MDKHKSEPEVMKPTLHLDVEEIRGLDGSDVNVKDNLTLEVSGVVREISDSDMLYGHSKKGTRLGIEIKDVKYLDKEKAE